MLDLVRYIRPLGLLAMTISIGTWALELMHLVEVCPYCQTERTMIGFLGILMILPHYRYLSPLLTMVLGMFGIHIACAQIFMHTKIYDFANMFTVLAACALFILSAQMLLLFA